MITLISLLRGINVSGQKPIRMPDLKAMYESLGFNTVTTYVQSGNIVFTSPDQELSRVRGMIEAEIERTFGFSVSVILRTRDEFGPIVQNNPFVRRRNIEIEKLYVTFLPVEPPAKLASNLFAPVAGADEFKLIGKELYLYCANGYGRTKLSNNFFERKLKTCATTRNWKTVNTLFNIVNAL